MPLRRRTLSSTAPDDGSGPTRAVQGQFPTAPSAIARPTSTPTVEPTEPGGGIRERSSPLQQAGPSAIPREGPGTSPEVELARIRASLAGQGVPLTSATAGAPDGVPAGAAPSRIATPPRPSEPSPISAGGGDGAGRSLAPPTSASIRRPGLLGGAGRVGGGLALPGGSAGGEALPTGLLLQLMRTLRPQGR